MFYQSSPVHILSYAIYNAFQQPRSQSSSVISDVTSPVKLVGKIALGSKLPLVTRIARTGLGTRLAFQYGASEDPDRVETLVSQFEEEP